jgi:hypothetical protein
MSVNRNALRIAATAVASGLLAAGALATAGTASAASYPGYSFHTLDNGRDPAFNQLLGINDEGVIAGYRGSGAAGQPNKGYLLPPSYGQGSYLGENFPGSVQTQVTGLNNRGVTVGFWSDTNMGSGDANFGFVDDNGHFWTADYPTNDPASPVADQLLGVNDQDVAVGFYTDGLGYTYGYEYDIATNTYSLVTDPHDPQANLTAAAISNDGDVAGFYTTGGTTDGFVMNHFQHWFVDLAVPGASSTMALGVNDSEEVVGTYTDGTGSSATMYGFTWTPEGGFTTVDDPDGIGTTTINGVNDQGDLVGFYTTDGGNVTDGFLATPQG